MAATVTSCEALDLLHWAMWAVVYRLIAIAIKMACDGGTFARHHRLFAWRNRSQRPCYCPFKLMRSYNINLIGNISLFTSYWPPPTTMEAVLATIVAGRRARIRFNIKVDITLLISNFID